MNCNGLKFSELEFEMYMENCIMRNEETSEIIVIQIPNKEGLIRFIKQLRKAN